MKAGTKAFGVMGIIICVAGSLVVLWGCGGGGKVAKRGDAAATMVGTETGADGPTQTEIAAVIEMDTETDTRKTEKAAGQGEPAGGSFTDPRDNQTYRSVRIGNQTWMAESLNHQTENSWCYDDDPPNCDRYGRLYTWEAAKSACSGLGGGWRLPNDAEWGALFTTVGGIDVAGSKLKSQTGWNAYSGISSTDDFGFSALPGGRRFSEGDFVIAGDDGGWWSATERDADYAWYQGMLYNGDFVGRGYWGKTDAMSVRCLRDYSGMR